MQKKLIVGAAIGDCVHVAGVVNFLNLAEQLGYQTVCLGPAVSIDTLLEKVSALDPAMVAVGYRLTPENCRSLLAELSTKVRAACVSPNDQQRTWLFGGTEPCVEVAKETNLFQMTFASGTTKPAVLAFLRAEDGGRRTEDGGRISSVPRPPSSALPPQTLMERIRWKAPYPLLRHHFGRPTVEDTLAGVVDIARAECLDVLSLGTDQNAQEHFFRPSEMDPKAHGAGGVPVRTEADLAAIYAHSRLGNHPLVRCYSGTRDTMLWAPMLARAINNAWCAIPLFWYTQLDGRSPRPLVESIPETQALMHWHAEHGIPVEMNESHHWSLRDAPDVVAVVAAFLAAYNARAAGVTNYVQQLMFNNPPNTSPIMDLGKMLAKLDLVEALTTDHSFHVWRETRGGLTSYPPDPSVARGHLAATVCLQMQLKPHIVHIVGHTEAHHATTAAELIEACKITDGAISQCLLGLPDMTVDPRVQRRKAELLKNAAVLLDAIRELAPPGCDPFTDAGTLSRAVSLGLLDAPHLRGNASACGKIVTQIVNGACLAVDRDTGKPIPEAERVERILAGCRAVSGEQPPSFAIPIGTLETCWRPAAPR